MKNLLVGGSILLLFLFIIYGVGYFMEGYGDFGVLLIAGFCTTLFVVFCVVISYYLGEYIREKLWKKL